MFYLIIELATLIKNNNRSIKKQIFRMFEKTGFQKVATDH